ncbi:MarR family winged helix-turn-helix transcriptional regulator [Flavobacterium sp.]|uniref:MarR family winged helix-turn-helix transcriptional regulator n=1 Tax=Flavobacterium sp. TaxID=239 RepID=UPI003D2C6AE6
MDKEILREIGQIYRSVNSFSDYVMKSINLEKGQYQFLVRIKENPGINQKTLSSLLLVDKTTTAKAVNKLVVKGYINKEVDEVDKRNFNLYLTEKGKKTCVFLDKEEKFGIGVFLKKLTEEQKAILMEQLLAISDSSMEMYAELNQNNKEYYIDLINKVEL